MPATTRRAALALALAGASVLTLAACSSDAAAEKTDAVAAEPASETEPAPETETAPAAEPTGALSVDGTRLVDDTGAFVQLRGVSTHGLAWFGQYVNADTFATFKSWGANCIRLALYTAEYDGYCEGGDQGALFDLVCSGVDAATGLGMYAIVDWHVLNDRNPLVYEDQAREFFSAMSSRYADNPLVLYEICNEPNGDTPWSDVKTYAEGIIPVIRANAPAAVIMVGTPTWSQDVDVAAQDPVDAPDLLYSLHFYAATHKEDLRARADAALAAGLPLFITEFGTCDAAGSGANDFDSASAWLDWADTNGISYCIWNVSNKAETSALLKPETQSLSAWSDDELSESGLWYKQRLAQA
jgi:endoglucanase